MSFVLRLARRELRAAWLRFLFFFICIALGVGAIVSLRSLIASVRVALVGEARTLLAADVLIATNRPWDEATRRVVERRLATVTIGARTESIETATMARPVDPSKRLARMIELRAVQPAFPFYGAFTLEDGRPYTSRLLAGRGALVGPELLPALDVKLGDQVAIGQATFTIRGVIAREPGRRIGAFSLGPRVVIDYSDLPATRLLSFGSRATYQLLFKLDDVSADRLASALRDDFKDRFVSVRSYRGTESDIGEDFARAENYLSLVGFVILVLGGIGVWSVTRVFVQQKLRSIAILKCLGATSGQILAAYVLQAQALGAAGSVIGVGFAAIIVRATPHLIDLTPAQATVGLTGAAVVQGIAMGLLVSLLFSLVPLLDVRKVKPLLLLRHEVARGEASGSGWIAPLGRVRSIDWLKAGARLLVGAAIVAVAVWQAGSVPVGLYVAGGFAALATVLHLAGLGLTCLVRPLAASRSFAVRHAVLSISRPGSQARIVLLAVGLGTFFIIGVRSLQDNLLDEFAVEVAKDSPDLFFIDIQDDQIEPVRRMFEAENPGRRLKLVPVLRARVTGVRGRELQLERLEDVRGRGLGREYVITYRDGLEPNERLVAGRFWGAAGSTLPDAQVSIEKGIYERIGVAVGDLVRFDVLGRIVHARVTSVREVDWSDARSGGFMFVFNSAVFRDAPHTWIAFLKGPDDVIGRVRLQHAVSRRFPNVSAIDMREILRTLERVLNNVTLGVSVIGGLALVTGALILTGAVAMTRFQRLYETAIFKTLGATTRSLTVMVALEYGALGLLAGLVGSLGALVLTWAISRYVLEIPWRLAAAPNVIGFLSAAVAVGAIGVLSGLDVVRRKPLSVLRAE
ncbi:MAG: ABC transporter permease [Acidobacteria bacterium]|nr:ABC transporter permease [Acidobacteriota bacterium]